ncbi:caspase 21, apoptosis-related cysteine peptidase isoform X2 [Triplophysa dalaica]|uniref:caspase 21, apoptosis-related cysteine peptidase isoform X2 n=1 Tax=Triplophysa dalaica TaxID=1582913 RepID=UPI0024DF6A90|nr:caspase 21, apoptosis-related cysteine peptidase isoform X2 [Triplophysa dalaica]
MMQWDKELGVRLGSRGREDHRAFRQLCDFESYEKHKHMGKCLIISNEDFPGAPRLHRTGCRADEHLLLKTFQSLGFNVQLERNLSADEMTAALTKASEDDHTDMSCFVCVLMSHGKEGSLLGSDQRWIPIKTLTSTMTADLCPTLQDKPKIFFLQACRGEMYDPGVETDSEEAPEFIGISDVPELDFLCCYSTVEGYYSWRNPQTGSVFICELCKMLMNSHLEIIQNLTRVNQLVANHFESYTLDSATHKKRQMPCFASRLTKDFYLHMQAKK